MTNDSPRARHRFGIAVLSAVLSSATFIAQTPTNTQKPSGLLLGQVVDAGTGKPIPGAVVALTTTTPIAIGYFNPAEDVMFSASGLPLSPGRVAADASGRFVFRDLPPGRYSLAALAPGYLAGLYGQRRPLGSSLAVELGDGEKLRDITIGLWQSAAMNGTVLDEAGEPAIGVQVRALRRTVSSGSLRWISASSALTDDRGVYRMANLAPGDFIVGLVATQTSMPASIAEANALGGEIARELSASGAPPSNSNGFRVGDSIFAMGPTPGRAIPPALPPPAPTEGGRFLVYQTVFYPASPTSNQATVLSIGSGEDRTGVDLRLRLVPGVRVSGVVSGPDGPIAHLGVRLLPAALDQFSSESGIEVATTATAANGAFTFLGVPAGEYTLRAVKIPRTPTPVSRESASVAGSGGVSFNTGPPAPSAPPPLVPTEPALWTAVPLNVANTDVAGLAVVLRPGFRVTGRLEFVGTKAVPTADQLLRMSISFSPISTSPAVGLGVGRATADALFSTPGFPPGRYLVRASAPGWNLVSAMIGGRDVSDQPLEIDAADIQGIVLRFSDQLATLSGTVRNSQGSPDTNAEVIIFPANHTAWKQFGVNTRRSRSVRTTRGGAYVVTSLPPGDYYVAAVGAVVAIEWQDPKFLESLVRFATRVTIADGEKKTADLQTGAGK